MDFKQYLIKQDRAENTIRGYISDLKHFSRWFKETNGEEFSPELLTSTDVRQYRQYLQVTQKAKPNTINRRLAMLKVYAQAACECGEIKFNPVTGIKWISTQEMAPRWL